MQGLKVKLFTGISMFVIVLLILIIGVWAVEDARRINLSGSIDFTISEDLLYVKDIRIRNIDDTTGQGTTIDNFLPGFVDGDIDINLGEFSTETSFTLLFDINNTSTVIYEASTNSTIANATISASGIIAGDGIDPSTITADTTPSGTIALTVEVMNAGSVNLDGIVINTEKVPVGYIYVSNVQINDSTPDSTTDYNGVMSVDDSLDLSNITFETGRTEIVLSMTSLNKNYIKNIVSYDTLNNTTSSDLLVHSTSLYLPQNPSGQLLSGESRDLKIYVNNNTGSPTTIPGLKVAFEEKTSLLQNDTTNQYYYVEMGTIMGTTQSEYIKWRYISADGENKYTYNSSTAPSGTGYFILETNVLNAVGLDGTNNMIELPFNADCIDESGGGVSIAYHHRQNGWENIAANDYSTSNIRQYINGNNAYDDYTGTLTTGLIPSGRYSNMYTDYNIDPENDLVFQNIIGRSLGDLYTGMGWNGNTSSPTYSDRTFPTFNEGATIKYTESDVDKFWLLSAQEAINLLGSSDADRVWPSGSANRYWLRSPHSFYLSAFYVYTSGSIANMYVYYGNYAARPAFICSI